MAKNAFFGPKNAPTKTCFCTNVAAKNAYTPTIQSPLKIGNVPQDSMSSDLVVAHQVQAPIGSELTIAKSSPVNLALIPRMKRMVVVVVHKRKRQGDIYNIDGMGEGESTLLYNPLSKENSLLNVSE